MSWHFQVIGTTFRHHVVTTHPVNHSIGAITTPPPVPTFGDFFRRYEHTPAPYIALRL